MDLRLRWVLATAPLTLLGCSRAKPAVPVDATLTRAVDVTGDGEDDTVTLHLTGLNSSAPFTWTLMIESDGKTVYHTERNDAEIDALFSDADAMEDCSGYAACKQRYYY